MIGEKFLLGINYWPRCKAMYWWKDFSDTEVEREFKEIKSLNLSMVRIFLLWEDFQPNAYEIYGRSLKNLEIVMEIAESLGLKIMPTLFVGHMSGVNWVPAWALSESGRSPFRTITHERVVDKEIGYFYRDHDLLEAQMRLIRTIVPKLTIYPSLFGWDVGNEISSLLLPKTIEDLDFWIKILSSEIKGLDPTHPITIGLSQEDLEVDKNIRLKLLSEYLDFPSIHGYSIYPKWVEDPLDYHIPPFLNLLTERLGGKKALLQEVGLAIKRDSQWMDFLKRNSVERIYVANEEEGKSYYRNILKVCHRIGALGVFIWTFSDYPETLKDMPPFDLSPHELYFGITKSDGSLKLVAEVLTDFMTEDVVKELPETIFDINEGMYFQNPYGNLISLFKRYKEYVQEFPETFQS
ncbi:MAG TPA: hypothetical protein EYP21_11235 [Syntrophaceae bacterium]|nr:hypothetical protein [Syntrophaceae bacterium]